MVDRKHIRTFDSSYLKKTLMNIYTCPASVKRAMRQYNTKQKAERFASKLPGTATDRREKRCIAKALELANVAPSSSVLDLPCGAGRLLPLLKKLGYKVSGADVSRVMLEQARLYVGPLGENCLDETDSLQPANIFETGFSDNCFDAVVCNRLLQYFDEADVRRQALKELRRICCGPIVVSFLCNLALDEVTSQVSDRIRGRQPHGCEAISCRTFAKDAREAGLVVKKWIPMRPLISRRWYAVLERQTAGYNQTTKLPDIIFRPKLRLGRVAAAVILIGLFLSQYSKIITDPYEAGVERIVKKYQDGNDHFYVGASQYLEDLHTGRNLSIISDMSDAPKRIATDRTELEDSFFLICYKDLDKVKKTPVWRDLSIICEFNLAGERFVLLTTELSNRPIKPKASQTPFSEEWRKTWV